MKLAIIRRCYTPYGGAERFIERIARHLMERGVNTTILAEQWGAKNDASASLQVVRAASSGWSRVARFRSFEQAVEKNLRTHSFDLVQSHERLMGADVYRAGDGVHAAWIQRRLREVGHWKARWLQRDPYHRAAMKMEKQMAGDLHLHFVANSGLVASELREMLDISTQRITVIPNGVDTVHFAPPGESVRHVAREQFYLPQDVPVVAFVGSGFARKGAFHLVEALRWLPDVFLLLCGHDKNRHALEALVKKNHWHSRVKILGGVEDVRPVLHAADVFALPSLYDPSPNAVLEALGCGLPIITTADTGLAQEIVAAKAGAICERDAASLASQIEALFADRDQHSMMASSARELAMKFDQEKIVGEWLDFYQRRMAPA